jgi:plasmid stabilization system protein ParE
VRTVLWTEQRPYRIVYRLVGVDEIHVLTVHHSSRSFPTEL